MWCSGTGRTRRPRRNAAGAAGAGRPALARRLRPRGARGGCPPGRSAEPPARRGRDRAGVAHGPSQRPADLFLELVAAPAAEFQRGRPACAAGAPPARSAGPSPPSRSEGGVAVVGRRGLEHRDVGVHGGAAAEAARLPRDLHDPARRAAGRRRRRGDAGARCGAFAGELGEDVVEREPALAGRQAGRPQPGRAASARSAAPAAAAPAPGASAGRGPRG